MQNADGPKGALGPNSANSENNLFNKHFNKELKLCEGKSTRYQLYIFVFLFR